MPKPKSRQSNSRLRVSKSLGYPLLIFGLQIALSCISRAAQPSDPQELLNAS